MVMLRVHVAAPLLSLPQIELEGLKRIAPHEPVYLSVIAGGLDFGSLHLHLRRPICRAGLLDGLRLQYCLGARRFIHADGLRLHHSLLKNLGLLGLLESYNALRLRKGRLSHLLAATDV